ncbi:ATP-dependent RNA helicase RhlE [Amaricoccus macauensis]|uniref:ATP-dependent RNA helicase RhlE n=1 Tax=Amaricoccus macauensis TaxID=57001 RepID=A0A840SPR4_9RHOB|nr:DEAD/DEAH box helicase [Amaricoccus macauensis]MBB5222565.1 ATP-dependent RNA helicase RhlE [Amaricoccus macauensis]
MTEQTFAALGVAQPLVDALTRAGLTCPTPIQVATIPAQLEGRDVLGVAQTGTGKTAAFGLPMVQAIHGLKGRPTPKTCRALILAPTRELAVQIETSLRSYAGGRLSTQLVLGGMSRSAQVRGIGRGVDVVIATPGRIIDLVDEGDLRLDETRFVVLDEADRMLDMGFINPVRSLVAKLHPRRQSLLFSATMPAEIETLTREFLKDPLRVEVAPQSTVVPKIEQTVELMPTADKRARLLALVGDPEVGRAIVFARTKRGADRVAENLQKDGVDAEVIHGNKAQNARQRALDAFRAGRVRVLVATDIVARGIDVPGITHVVNYDLPDEAESYVHRIGRTGRNGAAGIAVTLCAPDEVDKLRAVEKITRTRLLSADVRGEPAPKKHQGRPGGRGGAPKAAHGKPYQPKPHQPKPAHGGEAQKSGPQRRRPRRPRITRAA